MLANLGSVCYFSDRFDEAEEYYRRAEAITEHLPAELKNSAEGLASQAGSLTNQAELARLRGQYDRALELLEAIDSAAQAVARKMADQPGGPRLLFPHALEHRGMPPRRWPPCTPWLPPSNNSSRHSPIASQPITKAQPSSSAAPYWNRVARPERQAMGVVRATTTNHALRRKLRDVPTLASDSAETYRQRAHELIAKAHDAPQRTPDTVDRSPGSS